MWKSVKCRCRLWKLYVLGETDEDTSDLQLILITSRIQYHVALSITGTWEGINLSRIYEELDWESLTDRRWSRRLFHKIHKIYKIQNNLTPADLKAPNPTVRTHLFGTQSVNVLNEIRCKSKSYSSSFYPDSIMLEQYWSSITKFSQP